MVEASLATKGSQVLSSSSSGSGSPLRSWDCLIFVDGAVGAVTLPFSAMGSSPLLGWLDAYDLQGQ